METSLREADFGLNNFQRPKRLQDEEALARTILLILFGRPGCFPTLPEVGMNIKKYFYNFESDINPTDIKIQLAYQCSFISEVINEGQLDVQKVNYQGRLALRIIIPSLNTSKNDVLVIGITTNFDGKVIYNYQLMEATFSEFF